MTDVPVPLKVMVGPANTKKVPALVKLPPILSVPVPLTLTIPRAVIVRLAQTSPVAEAVMVIPAGTMTLSVATGAAPVDQSAPVSQAPVLIAVLIPAIAMTERSKIKQVNPVAKK